MLDLSFAVENFINLDFVSVSGEFLKQINRILASGKSKNTHCKSRKHL